MRFNYELTIKAFLELTKGPKHPTKVLMHSDMFYNFLNLEQVKRIPKFLGADVILVNDLPDDEIEFINEEFPDDPNFNGRFKIIPAKIERIN